MVARTKPVKDQAGWKGRYPVKKDYPLLWIILLFATFFRFSGLNEPGLWLDEVSYTIAAQRPIIDQILKSTETLGEYLSVDPTLSAIPFSLSLKLGFSNFLARFPAAVFGILSVALIYKLGRVLFSHSVGLVAALLLCTSSFHILYSQEARSYTQFVFVSTASFLCLHRAVFQEKVRYWSLYLLWTWAGVSTNHLMIFAIVAQGIFLLLVYLRRSVLQNDKSSLTKSFLKTLGYFSASLFIIFLMRVPWWEDFTQRQCAGCEIGNPAYTLDLVNSGLRSLQSFTRTTPTITVILIALQLIGLILALYQFPERGLLLACWLLLSIFVTTAGLWFISQFFHERYTTWGLPAFFLLVAYGLVSIVKFSSSLRLINRGKLGSIPLTRVTQFTLISLVLIPISLAGLDQAQQNPAIKRAWPKGQLQEAASKITHEANPGETIIAIGIPSRQGQFYINQTRQDLIYFDQETFAERAATRSLPQNLTGRWYLIHNPAYTPFNLPDAWSTSTNYAMFHDILVVHVPEACELTDCLREGKTLFGDISKANPGSRLAERIDGLLRGLDHLTLDQN